MSDHEDPEARRARNAKPENRAARRDYMHSAEGQAANRKAQENYKRAHPERVDAQNKARHAVGESGGGGHKCARCGAKAEHKHHTSYGGDGTAVKWLCHTCHVKAHHPQSNLGEKAEKAMAYVTTGQLRQAAIAKGMNDGGGSGSGPNWFEQYRGTPFFERALGLEQRHIRHEIERRQKRQKNESLEAEAEQVDERVRAERKKILAQKENIWEWDEGFYADQEQQVARLRGEYLEWLKANASPPVLKSLVYLETEDAMFSKSATVGGKAPLPKEHREAGATERADYADPENAKYPIHDEKHVRAAISYYSMPRNSSQYEPGKRAAVWGRIRAAAKRLGIELSDRSVPSSTQHSTHGQTGADKGEKSMGALETLKNRNLRDELTKSMPMVEHPRPNGSPEATAAGADVVNPNTTTVPMAEHHRPGTETVGKGFLPDEKKKPGDDDEVQEAAEGCAKADVNYARNEPGPSDAGLALSSGPMDTEAGSSAAPPSLPISTDNGQPSPGGFTERVLSADDPASLAEIYGWKHPMEQLAREQGGGDGMPEGMGKSLPATMQLNPFGGPNANWEDAARARAAQLESAQRAQAPYMRVGGLVLARGPDQAMAKAYLVGHQTANLTPEAYDPQSPLTQPGFCQNRACRKAMLGILTVCPECGYNHNTGALHGHGLTFAHIQKSVQPPHSERPVFFPFGIVPGLADGT